MHYPPTYLSTKFHCAHCEVYAQQLWTKCLVSTRLGYTALDEWDICRCEHCDNWAFWFQKQLVFPRQCSVPPAHPQMPKECISEYEEARQVVAVSPRAAAALLRLALQKLVISLGGKGDKINDDIRDLVAKGLPVKVQEALDICRVVGNNAVHPGELDLNDTPEIAHGIFGLLNFIVRECIERPKEISELYNRLPEKARDGIKSRDKTS